MTDSVISGEAIFDNCCYRNRSRPGRARGPVTLATVARGKDAFVMAGFSGVDHAATTAKNTGRMVSLMEQLVGKTKSATSGDLDFRNR